jgi:hypothetical protein
MTIKPDNWNEEIKQAANCEIRVEISTPGPTGGFNYRQHNYTQLGPVIGEARRILAGNVSLIVNNKILFDCTFAELAIEILKHDAKTLGMIAGQHQFQTMEPPLDPSMQTCTFCKLTYNNAIHTKPV